MITFIGYIALFVSVALLCIGIARSFVNEDDDILGHQFARTIFIISGIWMLAAILALK